MQKKDSRPVAEVAIESVSLYQTAQQRYLNYALSVITSRALPDVRDGLKPVQRRILYGMDEMHLSHEAKHQKSAQVVGQVMGRYHPHGDSAIYDAMVRLAQPFAMRYPLIDGQGNFGSIDGDTAAAMRYTEARMQPLASLMLEDLNEHIVDFQPNYSGTLREPTVLPAAIPMLLVNGSTGIAVGMSTNIPPHHLSEIIDGCIAMINDPELSLEALMRHIAGPDFPTGGRILNASQDIADIYRSGSGAIDIQGEYHLEEEGKRKRIIITSIPYGVNKSKLVETIAGFVLANKLPLLHDVRDESTNDIRIVLDLRPNADPVSVMAFLFKHSPLQSRFSVNMTCLVPGTEEGTYRPVRLGLCELIRHFIRFRLSVITRRLHYQLQLLRARIHILEGFAKLFADLQKAIDIIRNAEDKADAARKLCIAFNLDDIQAEAILQLRLYRMARLEIDKINAELAAKSKEAAHIIHLLDDEEARWKLVSKELQHIKISHSDARRTKLGGDDLSESYVPENYIIQEDCYVIVTQAGLFKRQKTISDLASVRVREGDAVAFALQTSTKDALVLFSSKGKAYTLLVDTVPATAGHGSPIAASFNFEDGERIVSAIIASPKKQTPADTPPKTLFDFHSEASSDASDPYIVAVSLKAQLVKLPFSTFTAVSSAAGRLFMRLNEGDTVFYTALVPDHAYISLVASNTRANVFCADDLPLLKAAAKGYRGMELDPGTSLAGCKIVQTPEEGVRVLLSDQREITVSSRRFPGGKRGAKGRLILGRGSVIGIVDAPLLPPSPTPPHHED